MNLDIQQLLQDGAKPQSGSAVFDFSSQDFGYFWSRAPVEFAYTATPRHGRVELQLHVKTVVDADCARCLAPFSFPFEVSKTYSIRKTDWLEEFPELPVAPDGVLDLEEMAYQELVLEIPSILHCAEDCPGLCARCGRVAAECRCEEQPEGDARLQVLRQLLKDDNDHSS